MTMQIAVAPSDSFEHWHQVTCRQYSITQCRAISDHAFSASIATRSFGDLVLSEIASTVVGGDRLRVVRSASDARRDGRDDFMFWLCLDGSTRFEQCGRIVELAPGDMMLHDQAYPFILEFGHTSRTTMITIARPLLTLRAPRAELLTARRIAASSPFATFARGLVESCVHSDSALPQHVAGRLANAALDIWSTTLEGTFPTSATSIRAHRRLEAAKKYMLAHLGNCELNLETIASAQNMSERTLVRLFALDGQTPMRWLWGKRLAHSHRLLAEHGVARVTDAALDSGFSDMSHFSRAFRTAFGSLPLEVLKGKSDI